VKRYWRVMLGARSALAEECFAGGILGGHYDLLEPISVDTPAEWTGFNKIVSPRLKELFPERSKGSIGLSSGQLWAISRGIQEGDVILAPDGGDQYRVGLARGPYEYVDGASLPHQRKIDWKDEFIKREDMSDALRSSLRSGLTAISADAHAEEIEALRNRDDARIEVVGGEMVEDPLYFAMEAHLEDFLVSNWAQTELGQKYDIHSQDGEIVGQQFPTDTGPIDVLAVAKDGSGYLVVELKRGRASDSVVGQILRYMSYVSEALADDGQTVRGAIIALDDDPRLKRALAMVGGTVDFYRYKVDFRLESVTN